MADNVAITAGSGTTIATDEVQVSGTNPLAHVQYVKIVDGTLNGTGAIGGDATNGLDVDVTRLPTDVAIADDGAFTVGTSKVIGAGLQAVSHGATPDVADALDAVIGLTNRHRIPFVLGGHPNLQSSEYFTSGAQNDDPVLPVISAGTIYVITGITVTCSAANATQPSVRIGFGGTTVPTQGTTGADGVAKVLLSHPGIPAGSGIVKGHAGGIVGIGGDGEDLRITCTTPTTSLIVQVDWFTITS
jgi:hypothetical protein